jgi:hypothetical protein
VQKAGEKVAVKDVKLEDIEYEVIGHRLAYKTGGIPKEAGKWLKSRGFQPDWAAKKSGVGFFVGLLMPLKSSGRTPILAFKGTNPSKVGDILADLDPVAVGFTAFQHNKKGVASLIGLAGGQVDAVGHSLGGALAQHAASAFAGNIRRLVTFQAPGITDTQAFLARRRKKKIDTTHHIATGDVVDIAGAKHLPGKFLVHSVGRNPKSHTQFLLTSDVFKKEREKVGLTDKTLKALGITPHKAEHSGSIKAYKSYPFWIRKKITEGARKLFSLATVAGVHAASGASLGVKKLWKAIF